MKVVSNNTAEGIILENRHGHRIRISEIFDSFILQNATENKNIFVSPMHNKRLEIRVSDLPKTPPRKGSR